MCPPALRGDSNFRSPEGEGNCELAGPERDESPGGAFEATFPTEGRDAGAIPPQPARCSRRNLGFRYPLGRVKENAF